MLWCWKGCGYMKSQKIETSTISEHKTAPSLTEREMIANAETADLQQVSVEKQDDRQITPIKQEEPNTALLAATGGLALCLGSWLPISITGHISMTWMSSALACTTCSVVWISSTIQPCQRWQHGQNRCKQARQVTHLTLPTRHIGSRMYANGSKSGHSFRRSIAHLTVWSRSAISSAMQPSVSSSVSI